MFKIARELLSQASPKTVSKGALSLSDICKGIEDLETYAERVAFAKKHLKHLSSGSSRVVYVTPDKSILKLAKNDRGLAQNKAESNPKMKSDFINNCKKAAKNHEWILMEYREKITAKEFEEMVGIVFKDFGECIKYGLKDLTSKKDRKKPKCFEEVEKTKIYKEFCRLGKEFKLMPGDMARISSFGTNGKHPILLDAGLTKAIFDKFYKD